MMKILIAIILIFNISLSHAEMKKFKYLSIPANDTELGKYIKRLRELDSTIYISVASNEDSNKIWRAIKEHQLEYNRSFCMIIDDMIVVGYRFDKANIRAAVLK